MESVGIKKTAYKSLYIQNIIHINQMGQTASKKRKLVATMVRRRKNIIFF